MVNELQNIKLNKGCFKLYKVNGRAFNLIILSELFVFEDLYSLFIYIPKFYMQSFTRLYLGIINVDSS